MADSTATSLQDVLSTAGYGDLPRHWTAIALGDLLSDDRGISVGVMYPGAHDPLGIPLIKAGDLSSNRINPRPEYRISPTVHREYRRTELEGGELLMTLVGNVGSCATVPKSMRGWNAARAIAVIRFQNSLDADYVKFCLQSRYLRHIMDVWSNTTVQQTLNLKEIKQLPIPWPDLHARRRIAGVLGALDDKIELNRKMNETLEQMAQAIFKSWFIDFDGHTEFEDSELGRIPKGWRVAPLDEIADFRNGLALQKFRPFQGEADPLPVIKIAQLRSGKPDSGEWATSSITPECIVDDGDVLFSWSGSLMVTVWCGGRGALNQHLFKVTSKEYPKWFFLHWIRRHLPEFQAIAAGKATTMGHIQRHHLHDALCVVPPEHWLDRGNQCISPLLDRQQLAAMESRTLAELRDTLLPKLISGELRIPEAEEIVSSPTQLELPQSS